MNIQISIESAQSYVELLRQQVFNLKKDKNFNSAQFAQIEADKIQTEINIVLGLHFPHNINESLEELNRQLNDISPEETIYSNNPKGKEISDMIERQINYEALKNK